jgi:hypothetical protein
MDYITGPGWNFNAFLNQFRLLTITGITDKGNLQIRGEAGKQFQTTIAEYTAVKDWIFWQDPLSDSTIEDLMHECEANPYLWLAFASAMGQDVTTEEATLKKKREETLNKRRDYIAREAFVEIRNVQHRIIAFKQKHEEREKDLQQMKRKVEELKKRLQETRQNFNAYKAEQDKKGQLRQIDKLLTRACNQTVAIRQYLQDFLHAKDKGETEQALEATERVREAHRKMMEMARHANKAAEEREWVNIQDLAEYYFGVDCLINGEFEKAEIYFQRVSRWKNSSEGKAAAEILKRGVLTVDIENGYEDYRAVLDEIARRREKSKIQRITNTPTELKNTTVEQRVDVIERVEDNGISLRRKDDEGHDSAPVAIAESPTLSVSIDSVDSTYFYHPELEQSSLPRVTEPLRPDILEERSKGDRRERSSRERDSLSATGRRNASSRSGEQPRRMNPPWRP